MTKDAPAAWGLMPQFLQRVYNFTVKHDETVDASQVCRDFEADFGSGVGEMYGLALVDEAGKIRGVLLAGIEIYRRRWPCAVVYQWEKEKDVGIEITHTCLQMVEGWARMHKLPRLRALAETDSRARLFGAIGFARGPVVVNKELSNG